MRKLCPACKEVWVESVPEKLEKWVPRGTPLYRAVGCSDCAMTGYRGRFSIVEVLTVTPEVERLIGAGATADRIAEAARAGGMGGLWESGLAHTLAGESSLDELMRVVDVPFEGADVGGEPVAGAREAAAVAPPASGPSRAVRGGHGARRRPPRARPTRRRAARASSPRASTSWTTSSARRRSRASSARCCWWTTKTRCGG